MSKGVARLRHAVTPREHFPGRSIAHERGCDRPALQHVEAQRGIADRPRHHHAVAGLCPAAMDHPARCHAPERGDRHHQRPRRRNRVAAEQRTAKLRGILAERVRERRKPSFLRTAQRQRQHKARRCRTLGGEIGQIHPQRLARDGIRRIVGEKMHAFHDGIGRDHDVVWMPNRRIVAAEGRVGRQRPK
jgi:hypothetical protein